MLIEKIKSYLPILVILFLLGGVYLGYANVWLCVGAFIVALTRLNKEEFIFVMLMTGAEYFGVVARIFVGFTVIPQLLIYLMVLVMLYGRINTLTQQNRMSNYLFYFLLLSFLISYLYGPQHAYSNTKFFKIILYGLLCFWTFILYNNEAKISSLKLAYIFAIAGVTYIVVGVTVYNFGTPSSILDFEYFGRHVQSDADTFALSYHSVGLAALYGVVFLLSPTDDQCVLKRKSIILLLILIFIALISQMRQGILGIIVLLFVRYVMLIKNGFIYKIFGLIFLVGTFIFITTKVQTDAFEAVNNANTLQQALNRNYDKAFVIMTEHPTFGLGLGGYSYDGKISYPHNIFLEIINEMGFVGLTLISILSLYAMWYNRFSWRTLNANNTYAILLLLALFIRINASGDLSENISFFALLFSMQNQKAYW